MQFLGVSDVIQVKIMKIDKAKYLKRFWEDNEWSFKRHLKTLHRGEFYFKSQDKFHGRKNSKRRRKRWKRTTELRRRSPVWKIALACLWVTLQERCACVARKITYFCCFSLQVGGKIPVFQPKLTWKSQFLSSPWFSRVFFLSLVICF